MEHQDRQLPSSDGGLEAIGPHADRELQRRSANESAGRAWLEVNASDVKRVTQSVAARAHTSHAKAYDAVVEAMIILARKRVTAENPHAFWVATATNLLYSDWRRPARERFFDPSAKELVERGDSSASVPNESHDDRIHRESLHATIQQLSEPDRTMVVEYYLQGKSLATIDRERGCSVGKARRQIHRARRRLLDLLRDNPRAYAHALELLGMDRVETRGR